MTKLDEIESKLPLYYDYPSLHESLKWLIARVRELEAENAALREDRDTWKRIAERNHRANMMPCPDCGYVPAVITAARDKLK